MTWSRLMLHLGSWIAAVAVLGIVVFLGCLVIRVGAIMLGYGGDIP